MAALFQTRLFEQVKTFGNENGTWLMADWKTEPIWRRVLVRGSEKDSSDTILI